MCPFSVSGWRPVACLKSLLLAVTLGLGLMSASAQSVTSDSVSTLSIMGRTIHVFRAPLGDFSAAERAENAHKRVELALQGDGEGWTSVRQVPEGLRVDLDGRPMFTVVPGDAPDAAAVSLQDLAESASHHLQRAWAEAHEQRTSGSTLRAAGRVAVAALILLVLLAIQTWLGLHLPSALSARIKRRLSTLESDGVAQRIGTLLPGAVHVMTLLMLWAISVTACTAFAYFALHQFVTTRAAAEALSESLADLVTSALHATADAIPGMIVAALVFLAAWVFAQISTHFFSYAAVTHRRMGWLDAHTVPATRRVVNVAIWLFAIAMAYPYLPGSHTQAFQGLSVLLGLMVSIGASGLVGQVASGVILVYTRAIVPGDYVRVQDCEGTVLEIGTFVTRMRTGLGQEVALPNALVMSNVIRNDSRVTADSGLRLEACVTIGYDTPWRQVRGLLLSAATEVPGVRQEPAPYVAQTALSDFYVAYTLVAVADAGPGRTRAALSNDLHAAIQDSFARDGVQIMSPHYHGDPPQAKVPTL